MTDAEIQGRLRALAEYYIALVEAMRTGQYADDVEWRALQRAHAGSRRAAAPDGDDAGERYVCALPGSAED